MPEAIFTRRLTRTLGLARAIPILAAVMGLALASSPAQADETCPCFTKAEIISACTAFKAAASKTTTKNTAYLTLRDANQPLTRSKITCGSRNTQTSKWETSSRYETRRYAGGRSCRRMSHPAKNAQRTLPPTTITHDKFKACHALLEATYAELKRRGL